MPGGVEPPNNNCRAATSAHHDDSHQGVGCGKDIPVNEVTVTTTSTDDYFFFDGDEESKHHVDHTQSSESADSNTDRYTHPFVGLAFVPRHSRRRHSYTVDDDRDTSFRGHENTLEKTHVQLKLKHAELLTRFDRVHLKLKKTTQENDLLREQVVDALEERDRAIIEAEDMLDLVESFKTQMDLMERDAAQLRRRLALYEEDGSDGSSLLVDFDES